MASLSSNSFSCAANHHAPQRHSLCTHTPPRVILLVVVCRFDGLRVLDIGCNVGMLTMDLVRKMGAAEVVGVDVDPALVRRARAAAAALPHPNNDQRVSEELGVSWVPIAFSSASGPVR